jgi:hypothetical protein
MALIFPKPTRRVGITIIDNNGLCSPLQLNILQDCTSLDFYLGKYNSLAEILNSLGVKVYICKGIIEKDITSFLDEAEEFWLSKLKTDQNESEEITKNLERIKRERKFSTVRIRGRYLPEGKIIELYPEEMKEEYSGTKVDELLVSTLAHETMHAYFDRPGHDHYPYAYFVEEPLAEFGMLLFLYAACMPMLSWAKQDVAGGYSCYRYGATLFDHKGDLALRVYLENYKCGISEYDTLDVYGRTIVLPYPSVGKKLQVYIPGGKIINCPVSADTFVAAIDEAAIQKGTAALLDPKVNKLWCYYPLMSDNTATYNSAFPKYQKALKQCAKSKLYVNTYSSNTQKERLLNEILGKLGLNWTVSIV